MADQIRFDVPGTYTEEQAAQLEWFNNLTPDQQEMLDSQGWDLAGFLQAIESSPGGSARANELMSQATDKIITPEATAAYEDTKLLREMGMSNLQDVVARQAEDRALRDTYFGRAGGEDRQREQLAMQLAGDIGYGVSAAELQGTRASDDVLRAALGAQAGGAGFGTAAAGLGQGQLAAGEQAAAMRGQEAAIGRTSQAAIADQIMGGDLRAAGIASGAELGYVGAGQGGQGVTSQGIANVYQNQLKDQAQALRESKLNFDKSMADRQFVNQLIGTGAGAVGSAVGVLSDEEKKRATREDPRAIERLLAEMLGRGGY